MVREREGERDSGDNSMSIFDMRLLVDISLMGQTAPEMSPRELSHNVEVAFNRLDTNGDGVLTRSPERIAVPP